MRVIAGSLRGRRLTPVPGSLTRPTADRVREALFSRLQSRYQVAGIDVLDLFAGTGALGIEALSRGARSLVAVERNRRAARVLVENLRACRLDGMAELIVEDVDRALARIGRSGRRFAGVFVDPPYGQGLAAAALDALAAHDVLAPAGWVTVESERAEEMPERVGTLCRVREDTYGDTKLTLYELVRPSTSPRVAQPSGLEQA